MALAAPRPQAPVLARPQASEETGRDSFPRPRCRRDQVIPDSSRTGFPKQQCIQRAALSRAVAAEQERIRPYACRVEPAKNPLAFQLRRHEKESVLSRT